MSEPTLYRRILAGQTGPWAAPLRGALLGASALYGLGVRGRNRWYDRASAAHRLPIPVISVGNITVGGTGKTPFVIDLVHRFERMKRTWNPVVVSRGYKASWDEPNDEERLIRRNCPAVACLADANRTLAAQRAHRDLGADVIVLDDGFQHRRLSRTLDIVLIDATCPFGYGYLLPRGLLREPITSLRRARIIVLTRCNQVSRAALSETLNRLEKIAPQATQVQCNHTITGLEQLDGQTADVDLAGKRALLFAAIGNVAAFSTTVRAAGVDVVAQRWWPDHHRYRPSDIGKLLLPGRYPKHDVVLTTEKDAVKLSRLSGIDGAGIVVVKVAIDFVGDGDTILQDVLETALAENTAS